MLKAVRRLRFRVRLGEQRPPRPQGPPEGNGGLVTVRRLRFQVMIGFTCRFFDRGGCVEGGQSGFKGSWDCEPRGGSGDILWAGEGEGVFE